MLTVSIVTPSYNYAQYLPTAIESVLNQTYPSIEYIVIDGGSTDGTLDVLRSYGDRVRWLSETDQGQSDAINKGLTLTSGEIVGWLNADDQLEPEAITQVVKTFQRYPEINLVYGDVNIIDADGNFVAIYPFVQPCDFAMLRDIGDFIVQPGAYWRRSAIQRQPTLQTDLNWTMDYELWLYLTRSARPRYIPHILASQREHSAAKTAQGGLARFEEIRNVVKRYGRNELPDGFQDEFSRWRFSMALTDPAYRDEMRRANAPELSPALLSGFALRHVNRQPDDLNTVLDLLHEEQIPFSPRLIECALAATLGKNPEVHTLIQEHELNPDYVRRLAWFEQGKFALIHRRKPREALSHLLKAHLWRNLNWWIFFIGTLGGGQLLRHYATRGKTALQNIPLLKRFINR